MDALRVMRTAADSCGISVTVGGWHSPTSQASPCRSRCALYRRDGSGADRLFSGQLARGTSTVEHGTAACRASPCRAPLTPPVLIPWVRAWKRGVGAGLSSLVRRALRHEQQRVVGVVVSVVDEPSGQISGNLRLLDR